jgi:MFS family permease
MVESEAVGPAIPQRNLQLLLLALGAAATAYALTAISPLQESLRATLSLSDNQMALLQGPARALPVIVTAIPVGLLIDRYTRVRLIFLFAVLNLLGNGLIAVASSFPMLFAARCLIGLSAAAIGPASFSLLADLYPPEQRGRANMLMVIGQVCGMSIAFALGGTLLAMSGESAAGLKHTMLWQAAPLLPLALAMLALREPPRTHVAIVRPSARETCAELWRYRAAIAPLLIGLVIMHTPVVAIMAWSAPILSRNFALSSDRIGSIMAVVLLVSGVLGPILGGFFADLCQRSVGPRGTIGLLAGLSLLGIPLGAFGVLPSVASTSVMLVLFMTLMGAVAVVGITLFTIVVPNELRGLCMAALAGAEVIFGVAAAPVMVSVLSNALGGAASVGTALAAVCIGACLLGAVTFALGRRRLPHT